MEQLMAEIRAYAKRRKIEPATVLQYAAGYGGGVWDKWQAGAQCTLATAEKIRAHMRNNPPSSDASEGASGSDGSLPIKKVGDDAADI